MTKGNVITSSLLLAAGMALGGAAVSIHEAGNPPDSPVIANSSHVSHPSRNEQHDASGAPSDYPPPAAAVAVDSADAPDRPQRAAGHTATSIELSGDLVELLLYIDSASSSQLGALATRMQSSPYVHLPLTPEHISVARALFRQWGSIDFDAAIAFVERNAPLDTELSVTGEMLRAALDVLAALHPDALIDWALLDQPSANHTNSALHALAQQDPTTSLFALVSVNPDLASNDGVGVVLDQWSRSDPASAWHWIQDNDQSGVLDSYRMSVMGSWLKTDAQAALLAIGLLPSGLLRNTLIKQHAGQLAQHEPEQALLWANSLFDHSARQVAVDTVIYNWARKQPEQVIAHIDNLLDPEARRQLLYIAGPVITSELTMRNPQRAMQWTQSMSASEQKRYRPMIFQQWIQQDATAALDWYHQQGSLEQDQDYLESVAPTLPYQNLPLALELFEQVNSDTQQQMAAAIVLGLSQQDPSSVQPWIDSLQEDQTRQQAYTGLLYASITTDPERALQLALSYQGMDRQTVLENTAVEVDQQHPGLIENWLYSAQLSEAERDGIINGLQRMPLTFVSPPPQLTQ